MGYSVEDHININCLVIGGGIIGISIAREFALNGIETILIEKNECLGSETSSRNSGVIHAGFYYPQDSLKSKLCNYGNKLIYEYCYKNNIYAKKTGKILVSNEKKSLENFKNYQINAEYLQGEPLSILNKYDIEKIEPEIKARYGLFSPETGILDVHGLTESFENDFLKKGGLVSLNSELISTIRSDGHFLSKIRSFDGEEFQIRSKGIVIATGLHSASISKLTPLKSNKLVREMNFYKGHYFKLSGKAPFKHLIYPLPTKYGLGIHSVFDIDGSVRFGPDNIKVANIGYDFLPNIKEQFVASIKKYWPNINPDKLHEDYVGIRPKIQKDKELFCDFSILSKRDHGIENFIFLQGIESPGLTCCMALAQYVRTLFKY